MAEQRWEYIENSCFRLRVPGGWIIKGRDEVTGTYVKVGVAESVGVSTALCFYPDEKHEWTLGELR